MLSSRLHMLNLLIKHNYVLISDVRVFSINREVWSCIIDNSEGPAANVLYILKQRGYRIHLETNYIIPFDHAHAPTT